jgi:dihydroneopterin aldolase
MSDFVIAHKIEAFCRIGCSEAERAFPQRLLISARLAVDTKKAATTKDLKDSVCYATVCNRIREIGASRPWVLVEELAEVCAERLFEEFSLISEAHLVIEKFILPGVEWVGVEIHRTR